jgi:two-component system NtrC family sensor kinase
MRLAWKLIAALVVGLGLVLLVSGWLRVGQVVEVFETDMRRDHEEVARVLEPTLRSAWARGGEPAVLRLLEEGAPEDGRLLLRWMRELPPSRSQQDVRSHAFPVTVAGQVVGGLLISERRDDERSFIRSTVVRAAAVTLALALVAAVIVMGFTLLLVGRPVRRLREKARRIAGGDLSGALEIAQRDEIGDLARDIDKMCDDLSSARQLAQVESEARTRATEQLRHADRLASVGTLSSGIAHELGTPLGVVLARARLIEEDGSLPRTASASAKIIAEQVERMSRIIRQLLDFSRSGSAKAQARPEPVDLAALARSVASLLAPMAHERQVRLQLEHAEPAVVGGDSGPLQQVLVNLVMNALQAMERPGAVTVFTGTTDAAPPAGVPAAAGRFARLRIEDQGPGIPPEVMPRIFEPFFTTKQIGEGTGLGLSVIWGIVREHGGWIEVCNIPQGGARFDVFLPAA